MNNQDKLFRFMLNDLNIRGELVYLDTTWKTVLQRSTYPANVQRQLGQALAAVAILAATIKFDGSLILQIQGNGPLRTLVTQSSNTGKLRGLAKWSSTVPSGSLEDVYGQGQIVITVKNAKGDSYQSIVALTGNNLSDALESYFANSEQLKSYFQFSTTEEHVSALFLQELPAGKLENKEDNWLKVKALAATVSSTEMLTLSPSSLLNNVFAEESFTLFSPSNIEFQCSCSKQKIADSLVAMGKPTVIEILEEKGMIDADCEFCLQHYNFSSDDINQLFTVEDSPKQPQTLH